MPSIKPVQYFRRRTAEKRSAKPTCLTKIASRPYIHPQTDSPLFDLLPFEIRTQIFKFALLGYPDVEKPYSRHSYHYRPGYTHARRIATPLLSSCCRIYLETSTLPIQLNTHIIYGGEISHAPPTYRPYLFPTRTLRIAQQEAIRSVHLFAQQYWLEDWNERDQWHDLCRSWRKNVAHGPEELRVTLRHTDWWYYLLGESSPLALDPRIAGRPRSRNPVTDGEIARSRDDKEFEEGSWGTRFSYFRGLKVFELELETLDSKRVELDEVVAMAPSWRFALGDDDVRRVLVMDPEATERYEWRGSSRFNGWKAHGVDPQLGLHLQFYLHQQEMRGGRLMMMTAEEEKELQHEDGLGSGGPWLDYYVVIMRWRVQDAWKGLDDDGEGTEDAGNARVLNTSSTSNGFAAPNGVETGLARTAATRHVVPTYWG